MNKLMCNEIEKKGIRNSSDQIHIQLICLHDLKVVGVPLLVIGLDCGGCYAFNLAYVLYMYINIKGLFNCDLLIFPTKTIRVQIPLLQLLNYNFFLKKC